MALQKNQKGPNLNILSLIILIVTVIAVHKVCLDT